MPLWGFFLGIQSRKGLSSLTQSQFLLSDEYCKPQSILVALQAWCRAAKPVLQLPGVGGSAEDGLSFPAVPASPEVL